MVDEGEKKTEMTCHVKHAILPPHNEQYPAKKPSIPLSVFDQKFWSKFLAFGCYFLTPTLVSSLYSTLFFRLFFYFSFNRYTLSPPSAHPLVDCHEASSISFTQR
jgi:hypothetical protein